MTLTYYYTRKTKEKCDGDRKRKKHQLKNSKTCRNSLIQSKYVHMFCYFSIEALHALYLCHYVLYILHHFKLKGLFLCL